MCEGTQLQNYKIPNVNSMSAFNDAGTDRMRWFLYFVVSIYSSCCLYVLLFFFLRLYKQSSLCIFQLCGCGQGCGSSLSLFPLLSLSGACQTQQQSMPHFFTLSLFFSCLILAGDDRYLFLFLVPWDGSIRCQTRQGQWHGFPQLQVRQSNLSSSLSSFVPKKHKLMHQRVYFSNICFIVVTSSDIKFCKIPGLKTLSRLCY